jgi:hypothetical protein
VAQTERRRGTPLLRGALAGAARVAPPVTRLSTADQLAQLGSMFQEGLLTAQEFAAAKARLLA